MDTKQAGYSFGGMVGIAALVWLLHTYNEQQSAEQADPDCYIARQNGAPQRHQCDLIDLCNELRAYSQVAFDAALKSHNNVNDAASRKYNEVAAELREFRSEDVRRVCGKHIGEDGLAHALNIMEGAGSIKLEYKDVVKHDQSETVLPQVAECDSNPIEFLNVGSLYTPDGLHSALSAHCRGAYIEKMRILEMHFSGSAYSAELKVKDYNGDQYLTIEEIREQKVN